MALTAPCPRHGTKPVGVTRAATLTAANAGDEWNAAASGTLGAWSFGFDSNPTAALRYNDYDGASDDRRNIDYCTLLYGGQYPMRCPPPRPAHRHHATGWHHQRATSS